MKLSFSITKKNLNASMSIVNCALASSSEMDGHYVISKTDEGIAMQCARERLYAQTSLQVESFEGEGDCLFTIEGKRLKQYVSNSTAEVLSFDFDSEVQETVCSSDNSEISFQSLDGTLFVPWGEKSEILCFVNAKVWSESLKFNRIGLDPKNETFKPELLVTEYVQGFHLSYAQSCFCQTTVPGLSQEVRAIIHVKDLNSVLDFMSKAGDGDLKVRDSEEGLVLELEDGSFLGVSRFQKTLPMEVIEGRSKFCFDPHVKWKLKKKDLANAIKQLRSGASSDDYYLYIPHEMSEGVFRLEMDSANKRKKNRMYVEIPTEEFSDTSNKKFNKMFALDVNLLLSIVSNLGEEESFYFNLFFAPNGHAYSFYQEGRNTAILAFLRT